MLALSGNGTDGRSLARLSRQILPRSIGHRPLGSAAQKVVRGASERGLKGHLENEKNLAQWMWFVGWL